MVFKILESFEANHPLTKSIIVDTEDFIGIIDATGPKSHHRLTQHLTSEVLQEILFDTIASSNDIDKPEDLLKKINLRIIHYYNQHDIFSEILLHPELRMTANLILVNRKLQQLWIFGQGQFIAEDELFQIKYPVTQMVLSLRQQIYQNYKSESAEDNRKIEADMSPFLISISQFQNKPESYSNLSFGVIDGFDMPGEFIHIIGLKQINELVLATKGYPKIWNTLAETEEQLISSLAATNHHFKNEIKVRPDLASRCYIRSERI